MNILYCRKSSESSDKQVASIDSQRNNLLELAKRHNLSSIKILTESMSAKQPGRPEFEKMIKLIEQNIGSVLFVWKLDRLARNPVDEGKIKWLLQNKVIAKIITPERIYLPEDNVLVSAVEFGMANQYIRDLSTNVKRGNKTKLEKGELPGLAPFGYLNDKSNHTVIVDQDNKHWIKFIFETYATGGYGIKDLIKFLNEKGLQRQSKYKLSKSYLYHILTNPFYIGIIRRLGVDYQGKHEPVISKVLFDTVQDVLSGKHRPKKQKHFFPVRGFMFCATCECLLTATTKKGHVYYYCTNSRGNCLEHKKYLRDFLADELVAKTFEEIKFCKEDIEIAYLAAKEKVLSQKDTSHTQRDDLAKKLKTTEQQLANLVKVISTDPSMANALKPQILSLEAEAKTIQTQISTTKEQTLDETLLTLEQTKKTFLQASNASFDYLNGDEVLKFELLKKLLWNLKIENRNVQCYQFKTPFSLLAKSPKNLDLNSWLGW